MRPRAIPLVAALLCGAAVPLSAQTPRIVAALDPDTVQVGETFTVGVVVTQGGDGEVRFPAALPLDEDLEQRGPVRIRSVEDGSEWRAYYTVVAWRAGTLPIPAIELASAATGSATLSVTPPRVVVRSLLPDEASDLELREARPFLRIRTFPWWVLLLFAAAAALAWWWWRGRPAVAAAAAARGPAADALREFERLRAAWREGRLSGDGFYDRFESALRRYARATRAWSPSEALTALAGENAPLAEALRRSVFVRFARVRSDADEPLSALDAGEGFVRSETPEEEDEGENGEVGDGDPVLRRAS